MKLSKFSAKIHIDNNWSAAKAALIVTGMGNYSDPYIIEDLVIDGGGSGSGIWIENSSVYFRIENCTIYNSFYGIRLTVTNNGALIENNGSNNDYGIYLWDSDNNTLIDNNIWNSTYNGIHISNSDDNNLSGNRVWTSTIYNGISLDYSNNNNRDWRYYKYT